MGKRWNSKEEKALIEFRHRLKDDLDKYPPYPDGNIKYISHIVHAIRSRSRSD